jgi:hypothetical protein
MFQHRVYFFGELMKKIASPREPANWYRLVSNENYLELFFFADFLRAVFLPVLFLPELFFLVADFRGDDFFEADFFLPAFFLAAFFDGTFCPFSRASDNPIAIACLRLLTFLPLRPLVSVPFFFRRMALSTVLFAFFEYLAIIVVFQITGKLMPLIEECILQPQHRSDG